MAPAFENDPCLRAARSNLEQASSVPSASIVFTRHFGITMNRRRCRYVRIPQMTFIGYVVDKSNRCRNLSEQQPLAAHY